MKISISIAIISTLLFISGAYCQEKENAAKQEVAKQEPTVAPIPSAFEEIDALSSMPDVATIDVRPSYETGQAYRQFRVDYPGVPDSDVISYKRDRRCSQVRIKIFKDGECEKPVINYLVPGARRSYAGEFYFALEKAEAGKYQVEICNGEKCSARGRSLTELPEVNKREKVSCSLVQDKEKEGKMVPVPVETFSLDVIPPQWYQGGYPVLHNKFMESPFTAGFIKRFEPTSDLEYKDNWLFTGYMHNFTYYKKLVMQPDNLLDDEHYFVTEEQREKNMKAKRESTEYSPDYCGRKYLVTANVHVVSRATKEVVFQSRVTMPYSRASTKKYILSQDPENAPYEFYHSAEIKDGKYSVWISMCMVWKDMPRSTVCSVPVTRELEVKGGEGKADPILAAVE